ncbi:hypothetical protein KAW65_00550 [candidate division WOR-3 bacterium]|nr:hypothetical protein [candidate division WOR-3 bacterium]
MSKGQEISIVVVIIVAVLLHILGKRVFKINYFKFIPPRKNLAMVKKHPFLVILQFVISILVYFLVYFLSKNESMSGMWFMVTFLIGEFARRVYIKKRELHRLRKQDSKD